MRIRREEEREEGGREDMKMGMRGRKRRECRRMVKRDSGFRRGKNSERREVGGDL